MYLVYRQRRMAYTFPLSETVFSESQLRLLSRPGHLLLGSPTTRRAASRAVACTLSYSLQARAAARLPASLGWLVATLANSLKKPQHVCPICDPDPDWFLLNRAGSQAHCLPPQESKPASKALLLLCPAPSSWCVFELDQSNSD